jgi:A/G-specific adenine glycosylase
MRPWAPAKIRRFQRCLLDWYDVHKRVLPWRTDPTPYHIWISEIMLQQTQVQTVLPYYHRFMQRFPDPGSLADASENELLELWAGLGYYARARNLHRAAQRIARTSGGKFPETLEELQDLPGIGRYTAGAICSIAYNHPVPVVDGNVRRVVSRLRALRSTPPVSLFWQHASAWVPAQRASDFNQAVMELGAVVCIPAGPACSICPVRSFCEARKLGTQGEIPAARSGRALQQVDMVALVMHRRGSILLSRQAAHGFIPGEWGLPCRVLRTGADARRVAANLARSLVGKPVDLQACGSVRHAITYRRIRAHVFRADTTHATQATTDASNLRWVAPNSLIRLITSSVFQKAIRSARPMHDAECQIPSS